MAEAALSPAQPLVVRRMALDDLEEALEVLACCGMTPIPPFPDLPEPEVSFIALENAWVATDRGRVVGVASWFDLGAGLCETSSFGVLPEYRGCGAGARLQQARLREMKRRGFRRVITHTDLPSTVEWMVRRYGYRVCGESSKQHPFGSRAWTRWVRLELDLDGWNGSDD